MFEFSGVRQIFRKYFCHLPNSNQLINSTNIFWKMPYINSIPEGSVILIKHGKLMTHIYLPFLKFHLSQSEGKYKPIISRTESEFFKYGKQITVPELVKQESVKVSSKRELSEQPLAQTEAGWSQRSSKCGTHLGVGWDCNREQWDCYLSSHVNYLSHKQEQ